MYHVSVQHSCYHKKLLFYILYHTLHFQRVVKNAKCDNCWFTVLQVFMECELYHLTAYVLNGLSLTILILLDFFVNAPSVSYANNLIRVLWT